MKATSRAGFTLIELLVVIAVIAVLVGLLLPAVQAAREARRAQCVNNLKQIGLAIHNYEGVHGTFPIRNTPANTLGFGYYKGRGQMVGLLPFLEQNALYDAMNQSLNPYLAANSTVCGTGVSVFWCPSDGTLFGRRDVYPASAWDGSDVPMCYSSYAGSIGYWWHFYDEDAPDANFVQHLGQENGPFRDTGLAPAPYIPGSLSASPGGLPPCSVASVGDGLSTTIAFGERNHGGALGAGLIDYWWVDGYYPRTSFTTFFTINAEKTNVTVTWPFGQWPGPAATQGASSYHPGGANFAFLDGSVHFLKDSIDTWAADPQTKAPFGVSRDAQNSLTLAPGTRVGVYQAISTINGGEVVGANAY